MTILIHPSQTAEANGRGLQWGIRLEFKGVNETNASGQSSKFWCVESIPDTTCEVIVRWGRIGYPGQWQRKLYSEALSKAPKKLSEGYRSVMDRRDLSVFGYQTREVPAEIKPSAEIVSLPEPYCRIATVVLGKSVETFAALDKDNDLVLTLSRNGTLKIFEMAPHIRDASPGIIL